MIIPQDKRDYPVKNLSKTADEQTLRSASAR